LEHAKSALHMWANKNNIQLSYSYEAVGPMHCPSFQGKLSVYVKELGRNLMAREAASTKQSASKSCALSIVRQMFHLGVFEVIQLLITYLTFCVFIGKF